jgi:hypothetical protein
MAGILPSQPLICAYLLAFAILFIGAMIWEGGASTKEGHLRVGASCPDNRPLPQLGQAVSDQVVWRLPGVSPSTPLVRHRYASCSAYYRAKFGIQCSADSPGHGAGGGLKLQPGDRRHRRDGDSPGHGAGGGLKLTSRDGK